MSSVLDYISCPRCRAEASFEYVCGTAEQFINCPRCGYTESVVAKWDEANNLAGYEHNVCEAAGALWYRRVDSPAYCLHALETERQVLDAERWLSDQLQAGTVESSTACLTRWNDQSKAVELVLGTFAEWSHLGTRPAAAEDLVKQQPRRDLRRFLMVVETYDATLRYVCGHTGTAPVLLLEEQKKAPEDSILGAELPCPECRKSRDWAAWDLGSITPAAATMLRRAEARWENLLADGSSNKVTAANCHPPDHFEAAAIFYATYPERKRKHPESIGFLLQVRGWSDQDIEDKKWLCDCAGCRATPMTKPCERP
jgi:hypothetical protein